MGFVLVISLPLIIFAISIGFGCYFLGKAKGRQEASAGVDAQVYGVPQPPSGTVESSPPAHEKKEGEDGV